MTPPATADFTAALERRFREAHKIGCRWLYVTASDLHREVGDYPQLPHAAMCQRDA